MIYKGTSITCQKHEGLNIIDQHNYSQCSSSSSSSEQEEVLTPLSQPATHPHDRYIVKCTKSYSNLLISFLDEIVITICLVVFIVLVAILKIAIHIAASCTIVYHKLRHQQTTRTNTTSIILEEQEESGGVSYRLSLGDLLNLSSFKYEMVKPTQEYCIVCLERFIKGESCRSLPRCKHVFHANCVDSWLIRVPSCPLCRQLVVKRGANQLILADSHGRA
ncbi:hypothetical protein MKX01_018763 [Papaver californicum]|nr:hypothetical protein MKX01_018763 [Papaver californicum]